MMEPTPIWTHSAVCEPPLVRKVSCCSYVSTRVEEGLLPSDFVVSPYTVLCGRGKECFESVGNRRFRVLVQCQLHRYSQADSKRAKSQIVSEIVEMVRSAGGAFVKEKQGCWYEVGDVVAREKVGALFRDCLFTRYRSASKCKVARRKQIRNSQRFSLDKSQLSKLMEDDEHWYDGNDFEHDDPYDDAFSITSAASLVKSGCISFRERRVSLEGNTSVIGSALFAI